MLSSISKRLATWLVESNIIADDEKELYTFAVFNILFTSVQISIFLFICLLLKKILYGMVIVATFMSIRRYSGGYHAKTPLKCVILSSISQLLCLWYTQCSNEKSIHVLLVAISAIVIWLFSPLNNRTGDFDEQIKRELRCKVRSILCIWLVIYLVLFILRIEQYMGISAGIYMALFFQLLAFLHQNRRFKVD